MYNTRTWNIIGWCSFVILFSYAAINIYNGLNGGSTGKLVIGVLAAISGSALLVIKLFGPE
jgi:hypothetical protein